MIFFEPTREWVRWLIGFAAERPIIDVGCGDCRLLDMLNEEKYLKMCGVDPLVDCDIISEYILKGIQVIPLRAEELMLCDYSDQVFVFARPSHTGFVASVLERSENNVHLYVSKPENVKIDIPKHYVVKELETPFLRCEKTYLISKNQS